MEDDCVGGAVWREQRLSGEGLCHSRETLQEKKEHIPSLSFFLLLTSSEAGDRWAPGWAFTTGLLFRFIEARKKYGFQV